MFFSRLCAIAIGVAALIALAAVNPLANHKQGPQLRQEHAQTGLHAAQHKAAIAESEVQMRAPAQTTAPSKNQAVRVGGALCDSSRTPLVEEAYVRELIGAPDVPVDMCPSNRALRGVHVFVATSIIWWRASLATQVGQALRQNATVLIHLGDENCMWGKDGWKHYNQFRLVLRQWTCWQTYHGEYARSPMVAAIPIGYTSALAAHLDPHASSSRNAAAETLRRLRSAPLQQELTWSLPGNIKADRQAAIDAFEERLGGLPNAHGPFPHNETARIMRASLFVLSGRGEVALECFRLYEASLSGAIPVLATTQAEYDSAFGHYCSSPPWIVGTSWPDAAAIVAELLRDKHDVRRRQLAVVRWWVSELRCAQAKVGTVLGLESTLNASFRS